MVRSMGSSPSREPSAEPIPNAATNPIDGRLSDCSLTPGLELDSYVKNLRRTKGNVSREHHAAQAASGGGLVVPPVAEHIVTLGAQIEPFPFSVFTLPVAASRMLAAALAIVSCGTRHWAITT